MLDQLSLVARELFRRLHLNGRKQVASPGAVDVRHPLALQSQGGAGLCAFGDLHGLGAVERRHLHFATERHGREVDRDFAEQVVAVAAEELVLVDVDDDVEMAGGAAGSAALAFTLQPELLPGRNAGGGLSRWPWLLP